ncbi:MFS transporter [Rhodococcus opacus]|uniref:MFS transporter n=1 Tax=Rhodococcus opacus TaxID=37919 RepID=UPI001C4873BE|nr:MFS transporter [Rhodococcus opacus]MBV6760443.1 MFS transporter [Rhodococcus opacus]
MDTRSNNTAPPVQKAQWGGALLLVFAQATQAMVFGSIALFLPLLRVDLGISYSQAGLLASASVFSYAMMQIPSGYVADRFDPRKIFLVGLVGVNVLSILFVVSTDFPVLVANQFISGVFRSLLFSPGMILITRLFRPDQKATGMGLFVAGGFSSNLVVNLLAPFLIEPLGWRGIFVLFSLTGLIAAVAFWKTTVSEPRPATSALSVKEIAPTLREPVMILVAVIQFVRLALVTGMAFWLPSILQEDKGFSLQMAGLLVALGSVITAPSNIVGGMVSDRLGKPIAVIVASMVAVGLTTIALTLVEGLVGVIIVVAANALVLQLYFGPLFAVATELLPHRQQGLVTGIGNFWANVGGFTASYVMGTIKEATGSFDVALYLLASICIAGVGAAIGLDRLSKRTTRTPDDPNAEAAAAERI